MNRFITVFAVLLVAGVVGFITFTKNSPPVNNTLPKSAQITVPSSCSGKETVQLTEGPYFKANSPKKDDFSIDAAPGTPIVIAGFVFDTDCKPIAGASLDFWQADGKGHYDNAGYILRGHQVTNRDGKYKLTTVIPGEYPGRTPHIHVKVRATNTSPIITSQLFIPGVVSNDNDSIYDSSLLINKIDDTNATYNFVLAQ